MTTTPTRATTDHDTLVDELLDAAAGPPRVHAVVDTTGAPVDLEALDV